jgi:uncharacterized membrane protein YidH (DUF202 family)
MVHPSLRYLVPIYIVVVLLSIGVAIYVLLNALGFLMLFAYGIGGNSQAISFLLPLLIIPIGLILTAIINIYLIEDCIKRTFAKTSTKVLLIAALLLLGPLSSVPYYYAVGRKPLI